jgi:hypothetical protein
MRAGVVVLVFALSWSTAPRVLARAAAPHVTESLSSLWEEPVDLQRRDLFDGPWGRQCAPDPSVVYTFVRKKEGGVNPGVVVRDPAGRIWHVKQSSPGGPGDEGPVEVTLSRVLSAIGYHQPPVYYVSQFLMRDESGRARAEAGGRFRLDTPSMKDRGSWAWQQNPFAGTRPFNALLVILLMFNSWDLKDSNNTLYDVNRGDTVNQWFVVRDLGGALGASGRVRPRRNDADKFERQIFLTGAADGFARFAYHGKQPELFHDRISIDDVHWAANLIDGLSDRQWNDAFAAGGYTQSTSARFIHKVRANINEARRLTASGEGR